MGAAKIEKIGENICLSAKYFSSNFVINNQGEHKKNIPADGDKNDTVQADRCSAVIFNPVQGSVPKGRDREDAYLGLSFDTSV